MMGGSRRPTRDIAVAPDVLVNAHQEAESLQEIAFRGLVPGGPSRASLAFGSTSGAGSGSPLSRECRLKLYRI